jgi:endonuclease III
MNRSDYPIETVLDILDKAYPYHPMADVTERDPYKLLVCILLSLRTLDTITMPACTRLFMAADTPEKILGLSHEKIAELIYPVKYYNNKARILHEVTRELLDRFGGRVPDTVEDLVTIKGVGRKTANLVVALGYNRPAISVDTHVHRITNRLGYVATKSPEQTEQMLRQKLPVRYWIMINRVMVRHGQAICRPQVPLCEICPVNAWCRKVGVKQSKPTLSKRTSTP